MNWANIIKDEMQKISSYEGSVIPNLKVPNTYRRWRFGCRKLLKLWYRIENHNLYWKPLIDTLKEISTYYIELSGAYQHKIASDPVSAAIYISELKRLSSAEYEDSDEVVVDKERERANKRCSICYTELVYPAYIIYRNGEGDEVKRSRPIGIMCLNSSLSRFKKLLNSQEFVKVMKQVGRVIKAEVGVEKPIEDIEILLDMPDAELKKLRKETLDTVMFINMFHNKDKVEQLKEKLLQVQLSDAAQSSHIFN